MKIRRIQANNFRVAARWFGKQIFVGSENVGDAHVVVIRIAARAEDVAVEIDGVLVVGRDRKDAHAVAILHVKRFEFRGELA